MSFSQRQWFYLKILLFTLLILGVIGLIQFVIPVFSQRLIVAFFSIFTPLVIAFFLRYLVLPIDQALIKMKIHSSLMRSLIMVSTLVLGTALILLNLGNLIYLQARLFIENDWPQIIALIESNADQMPAVDAIYSFLADRLSFDQLMNLPIDIFGIFESITTFLLTVVLTPIFLFFILKEGAKIWQAMMAYLPASWQKDVGIVAQEADLVIRRYFKGRFILIIILAVMSTVGFFILGFRTRSLLFGVILGVLDIVPFLGPFIGASLPLLYSLTDDSLRFGAWAPVAVVIVALGSQLVQTNLIQPFIMSKETNIHPLLVLSSLLFFGVLLGVVGIILAIPFVGTLIAVRKHYVKPPKKTPKRPVPSQK